MPKRTKKSIKTNTRKRGAHHDIRPSVHYLTVLALLISNLSVLTLGMIFANTMGASMGDLERIAIRSQIQKIFTQTVKAAGRIKDAPTPLLIISLGEDTRARLIEARPDTISLKGSFAINVDDDIFTLDRFDYRLEYFSTTTATRTVETFSGFRAAGNSSS